MVQVTVGPAEGVWSAHAGGVVLAQSMDALELVEGSYPPVIYFPRGDVAMDLLVRSERSSVCPLKGTASYFSLITPSVEVQNLAWSYEVPKQSMGGIAGYLAFYPDKVVLRKSAG